MAWFKKPEEGELEMVNASPAAARAEPREPRVEPRTPMQRAPEQQPTEAARLQTRAPEPRAPESRAPESRAPESRAPETRTAQAAPRPCVLGPTLHFRGELSAQEDLIIQGSVEGSITHTQSLTIGTDGSMKGDIRARVIVIDGIVNGDLHAGDFVNIRATAKVKGNVFAPRVGITDGAFFQGRIEMQASVQRLKAAPELEAPAVDHMLSGT